MKFPPVLEGVGSVMDACFERNEQEFALRKSAHRSLPLPASLRKRAKVDRTSEPATEGLRIEDFFQERKGG